MGPQAELLAETAGKRGYLDCLVQNLRTSMVTSSMANLADLMEDEKIPPFMPMIVRISNSDITLRVRFKPHSLVAFTKSGIFAEEYEQF